MTNVQLGGPTLLALTCTCCAAPRGHSTPIFKERAIPLSLGNDGDNGLGDKFGALWQTTSLFRHSRDLEAVVLN